jgi:copper transport protein
VACRTAIRSTRPFGVSVLVAAGMALFPAPALGHAAFQDASPEPAARLGSAPATIDLVFTEPLNRQLTTATITNVRTGRRVAASVTVEGRGRLLLRPRRRLPTGAFRVNWHTVSILDGHALEGSFGFGVRTSAIGGEQRLEQSPLARAGLLRILLRGLWYVALFFFGGGLLCAAVLRSRPGPASWLLSGPSGEVVVPERTGPLAEQRIWRRTRAAGWLAVAAGLGVALVETWDAAGSLSWPSVDAFLFSTTSGEARALAVAAVALAALAAARVWRLAALALVAALAAVAVGGHANSAHPRALALLADWLHLVAGTMWVGGIAQIAATWVPGISRLSWQQRRQLIATVLERFGRLALPAAAVVVLAGAGNALLELGRIDELWTSAYGRALLVKIALVSAVLATSYLHVFLLRPRVIAGGGDAAAERRHWRLLGGEPALAAAVLAAGALLAVFPLPPRQLLERAEADESPRPQAAAVAVASLRPPRARELAVADQAGPWIAAAWVQPAGDSGTIRLLDYNLRSVPATIRAAGATVTPCGKGCVVFHRSSSSAPLRVIARAGRRTHRAVIPIRWAPTGTSEARSILTRAVAGLNRLRTQRIAERLSSGLGRGIAISRYRVAGRHSFGIVTRGGGASETIVIGRRYWVREPDRSWQYQVDTPIDTRELMPWWTHRTGVRLLDIGASHGRRIADIALADIPRSGQQAPPFWFRLRIELRTLRVLSMRMIAPAHFMDQRYYAFNVPVRLRPPARGH